MVNWWYKTKIYDIRLDYKIMVIAIDIHGARRSYNFSSLYSGECLTNYKLLTRRYLAIL